MGIKARWILFAATVAAALGLAASPARAQDIYTWDGVTNDAWTDDNWDEDGFPGEAADDVAVFTDHAAGRYVVDLYGEELELGILRFQGITGGFTIQDTGAGPGIWIGSIDQQAGDNTVSARFIGTAGFTAAITGGGLTLSNQDNVFNVGHAFSVSGGAATLAVKGTAGGDADINLDGGTLELSPANVQYQFGALDTVFRSATRGAEWLRYNVADGGQYQVVAGGLLQQQPYPGQTTILNPALTGNAYVIQSGALTLSNHPDGGQGGDNFQIAWTGQYHAPETGWYEFRMGSETVATDWLDDDGVIYIDRNHDFRFGALTYDPTYPALTAAPGESAEGSQWYRTGTGGQTLRIYLEEDQVYNVAMGFRDATSGQAVGAYLRTPSMIAASEGFTAVNLTTQSDWWSRITAMEGHDVRSDGRINVTQSAVIDVQSDPVIPTRFSYDSLSVAAGQTLTKQGYGALEFRQEAADNALGAGSTLRVERGTLGIDTNAASTGLGSATIDLAGGVLSLTATDDAIDRTFVGQAYFVGSQLDGNYYQSTPVVDYFVSYAASQDRKDWMDANVANKVHQPMATPFAVENTDGNPFRDLNPAINFGTNDNLIAIWDGVLRVTPEGAGLTYTFASNSDDGSGMFLHDGNDWVYVVNNNYMQAYGNRRAGSITLEEGDYPVRLFFYEATGHAGYLFDWSAGGAPVVIDPAKGLGAWQAHVAYGNNIVVRGGATSTIDLQDDIVGTFGTLTAENGATLRTTGDDGSAVIVTSTTFSGTLNIDAAISFHAGPLSGAGAATLVKHGAGNLVVEGASSLASGSLVESRAGRIIGLHDGTNNPFSAAALRLRGGEIALASTDEDPRTFTNDIESYGGALLAGASAIADPATVTAGGALDLKGAGTMTRLGGVSGSTLQLTGALTGDGNVRITGGNVVLDNSSANFQGRLDVAGGNLTTNAAITNLAGVSVTGGSAVFNAPVTAAAGGMDYGRLEHRGYQGFMAVQVPGVTVDATWLDLHQGGGMLGLTPSNSIYFIDGPAGRGIEFLSDADFHASGAIASHWPEYYSNLFIGYLNVTAETAGDYTFRIVSEDDRGGIWIDLNLDGVFQSSVAGLGSDRGEQLAYDNTALRTVNLAPGSYLFAVTHAEYTDGTNIRVAFSAPGLSERVIKPGDPEQAGFWSVLAQGALEQSGGTVDINSTFTTPLVAVTGGTLNINAGGAMTSPSGVSTIRVTGAGTLNADSAVGGAGNQWQVAVGRGADERARALGGGAYNALAAGSVGTATPQVNFGGTLTLGDPDAMGAVAQIDNAGLLVVAEAGAGALQGVTVNFQRQGFLGGALLLESAQPAGSFPTLNVPAYSALIGDLTGAVYSGAGKNVTLAENAILGWAGGALPDVVGAPYYMAVLDFSAAAEYRVGDPDDIYKGLAIGLAWSPESGAFEANLVDGSQDARGIRILMDRDVVVNGNTRFDTENDVFGLHFVGAGTLEFQGAVTRGEDSGAITRTGLYAPADGADLNPGGFNTTKDFVARLSVAGAIASDQVFTVERGMVHVPVAEAVAGTLQIGPQATLRIDNLATGALRPTTGTYNVLAGGILDINTVDRLTAGATFMFQSGAFVHIRANMNLRDADSRGAEYDFADVNKILSAEQFSANAGAGIRLGHGTMLVVPRNYGRTVNADSPLIKAVQGGPGDVPRDGLGNPTEAYWVQIGAPEGSGSLAINSSILLSGVDIIINDFADVLYDMPGHSNEPMLARVPLSRPVTFAGSVAGHQVEFRNLDVRSGLQTFDANVTLTFANSDNFAAGGLNITGGAVVRRNAWLDVQAQRPNLRGPSSTGDYGIFQDGIEIEPGGRLHYRFWGDGGLAVRNVVEEITVLGRAVAVDPANFDLAYRSRLGFRRENNEASVVHAQSIYIQEGSHLGVYRDNTNDNGGMLGRLKQRMTVHLVDGPGTGVIMDNWDSDWTFLNIYGGATEAARKTLYLNRVGGGMFDASVLGTIGAGNTYVTVDLVRAGLIFDIDPAGHHPNGNIGANTVIRNAAPIEPGRRDSRIYINSGRDGTGGLTGGRIDVGYNRMIEIQVEDAATGDPSVVNTVGTTIRVIDDGLSVTRDADITTRRGLTTRPVAGIVELSRVEVENNARGGLRLRDNTSIEIPELYVLGPAGSTAGVRVEGSESRRRLIDSYFDNVLVGNVQFFDVFGAAGSTLEISGTTIFEMSGTLNANVSVLPTENARLRITGDFDLNENTLTLGSREHHIYVDPGAGTIVKQGPSTLQLYFGHQGTTDGTSLWSTGVGQTAIQVDHVEGVTAYVDAVQTGSDPRINTVNAVVRVAAGTIGGVRSGDITPASVTTPIRGIVRYEQVEVGAGGTAYFNAITSTGLEVANLTVAGPAGSNARAEIAGDQNRYRSIDSFFNNVLVGNVRLFDIYAENPGNTLEIIGGALFEMSGTLHTDVSVLDGTNARVRITDGFDLGGNTLTLGAREHHIYADPGAGTIVKQGTNTLRLYLGHDGVGGDTAWTTPIGQTVIRVNQEEGVTAYVDSLPADPAPGPHDPRVTNVVHARISVDAGQIGGIRSGDTTLATTTVERAGNVRYEQVELNPGSVGSFRAYNHTRMEIKSLTVAGPAGSIATAYVDEGDSRFRNIDSYFNNVGVGNVQFFDIYGENEGNLLRIDGRRTFEMSGTLHTDVQVLFGWESGPRARLTDGFNLGGHTLTLSGGRSHHIYADPGAGTIVKQGNTLLPLYFGHDGTAWTTPIGDTVIQIEHYDGIYAYVDDVETGGTPLTNTVNALVKVRAGMSGQLRSEYLTPTGVTTPVRGMVRYEAAEVGAGATGYLTAASDTGLEIGSLTVGGPAGSSALVWIDGSQARTRAIDSVFTNVNVGNVRLFDVHGETPGNLLKITGDRVFEMSGTLHTDVEVVNQANTRLRITGSFDLGGQTLTLAPREHHVYVEPGAGTIYKRGASTLQFYFGHDGAAWTKGMTRIEVEHVDGVTFRVDNAAAGNDPIVNTVNARVVALPGTVGAVRTGETPGGPAGTVRGLIQVAEVEVGADATMQLVSGNAIGVEIGELFATGPAGSVARVEITGDQARTRFIDAAYSNVTVGNIRLFDVYSENGATVAIAGNNVFEMSGTLHADVSVLDAQSARARITGDFNLGGNTLTLGARDHHIYVDPGAGTIVKRGNSSLDLFFGHDGTAWTTGVGQTVIDIDHFDGVRVFVDNVASGDSVTNTVNALVRIGEGQTGGIRAINTGTSGTIRGIARYKEIEVGADATAWFQSGTGGVQMGIEVDKLTVTGDAGSTAWIWLDGEGGRTRAIDSVFTAAAVGNIRLFDIFAENPGSVLKISGDRIFEMSGELHTDVEVMTLVNTRVRITDGFDLGGQTLTLGNREHHIYADPGAGTIDKRDNVTLRLYLGHDGTAWTTPVGDTVIRVNHSDGVAGYVDNAASGDGVTNTINARIAVAEGKYGGLRSLATPGGPAGSIAGIVNYEEVELGAGSMAYVNAGNATGLQIGDLTVAGPVGSVAWINLDGDQARTRAIDSFYTAVTVGNIRLFDVRAENPGSVLKITGDRVFEMSGKLHSDVEVMTLTNTRVRITDGFNLGGQTLTLGAREHHIYTDPGAGRIVKNDGTILNVYHGHDGTAWTTAGGALEITLAGMTGGIQVFVDEAAEAVTNATPIRVVVAPGASNATIRAERARTGGTLGTVVFDGLDLGAGTWATVATGGTAQNVNIRHVNLGASGTLNLSNVGLQPDTLVGAGSIINAGTVTVAQTLAPGNSFGTIGVTGNLMLGSGSTYAVELAGQGDDRANDRVNVSAALTILSGGALTLNWVPGSDASSMFGGTYRVATYGTLDGTFAAPTAGNSNVFNYIESINYAAEGGTAIDVVLYDLLAGDADLDGKVDVADYVAVARNFGVGTSWLTADVTFDGKVDVADYVEIARNFGAVTATIGGLGIDGSGFGHEPAMLDVGLTTTAGEDVEYVLLGGDDAAVADLGIQESEGNGLVAASSLADGGDADGTTGASDDPVYVYGADDQAGGSGAIELTLDNLLAGDAILDDVASVLDLGAAPETDSVAASDDASAADDSNLDVAAVSLLDSGILATGAGEMAGGLGGGDPIVAPAMLADGGPAVVPEPGTWAMLVVLAGMASLVRRRRNVKKGVA